MELVRVYGDADWERVSDELSFKSSTECNDRYQHLNAPARVKGHWTHEEDELLRMYVQLHGSKDWSQVRQLIPGRVPKQCRERWLNVLSPTVNKGQWRNTEDKKI